MLTVPNRKIPAMLRHRLLLGGALNQIGWGLFGFGMIFVWLFALESDFSFLVLTKDKTVVITGKSVGSYETNMSVNDRSVYCTEYEFSLNGEVYKDFSYATGRSYEKGRNLKIEYLKGDPGYSRIQGMRRSLMGWGGVFSALPALLGLFLVFLGMKKGLLKHSLLKNGFLSRATLVNKEGTNTSINDKLVYKLTFEFIDNQGTKRSVIEKTHNTEKLEDDEYEEVLYLHDVPDKAVFLDTLPKDALVEENMIKYSGGSSDLMILVIPFISIIGHLYWSSFLI